MEKPGQLVKGLNYSAKAERFCNPCPSGYTITQIYSHLLKYITISFSICVVAYHISSLFLFSTLFLRQSNTYFKSQHKKYFPKAQPSWYQAPTAASAFLSFCYSFFYMVLLSIIKLRITSGRNKLHFPLFFQGLVRYLSSKSLITNIIKCSTNVLWMIKK